MISFSPISIICTSMPINFASVPLDVHLDIILRLMHKLTSISLIKTILDSWTLINNKGFWCGWDLMLSDRFFRLMHKLTSISLIETILDSWTLINNKGFWCGWGLMLSDRFFRLMHKLTITSLIQIIVASWTLIRWRAANATGRSIV